MNDDRRTHSQPGGALADLGLGAWDPAINLQTAGRRRLGSELIDLVAARRRRLEDEELRLLGHAVGDHIAPELLLRVEVIRRERADLEFAGQLGHAGPAGA